MEHLDFGIDSAPDYPRPDLLEDVRLRQAIATCIDRQRIVDQVYLGQAVAMHSYIPLIIPLS